MFPITEIRRSIDTHRVQPRGYSNREATATEKLQQLRSYINREATATERLYQPRGYINREATATSAHVSVKLISQNNRTSLISITIC